MTKSYVRPTESDLTVTCGSTTAVVALPHLQNNTSIQHRRQKAFEKLTGQKDMSIRDFNQWDKLHGEPANPNNDHIQHENRAFRREQIRIKSAMEDNYCGQRMEQRLEVCISSLPIGSRSWGNVFIPILNFARFFNQQPDTWCKLLRMAPTRVCYIYIFPSLSPSLTPLGNCYELC